jgi:hypothetical protein
MAILRPLCLDDHLVSAGASVTRMEHSTTSQTDGHTRQPEQSSDFLVDIDRHGGGCGRRCWTSE